MWICSPEFHEQKEGALNTAALRSAGVVSGGGLPCSNIYSFPPRLMPTTLFKLSESLTQKGMKVGRKKKSFCRRKEDETGKRGEKD